MEKIPEHIAHFLSHQGFIIVSTVDERGYPHNSCKGIVKLDVKGEIYLMDLYKAKTYENLKQNASISITAVDEHKFIGWCLKGRAKEIKKDKLELSLQKAWDEKITSRITHRVIKNVRGEKGHPKHPEIMLPKPEYMIIMEVQKIINLAP